MVFGYWILALFGLPKIPCVLGKTETACYGVPACRYYSLTCEPGTVIHLTSLQYGSKKRTCNIPTSCTDDCCIHQATDCLQNMTQDHAKILYDYCSGKEMCINLDATQGPTGNCNKYSSYVFIQYDCITVTSETTSRANSTVTTTATIKTTTTGMSPSTTLVGGLKTTTVSTTTTAKASSATTTNQLTPPSSPSASSTSPDKPPTSTMPQMSSGSVSSGVSDKDDNVSSILVGVFVPLIVIIAVIIALFTWWKRHQPVKGKSEPATSNEYVDDMTSSYAEISSVPSVSADHIPALEPIYDPVNESRNGTGMSRMVPVTRHRDRDNMEGASIYDPVYEPSSSGNRPAFMPALTKKNKNLKTKASEKLHIPAKMIKDQTDKIIAFFRKQPNDKPNDKETDVRLQKLAENVVDSYDEINVTPTGTVEMTGKRVNHCNDGEMKLPERKFTDSIEKINKLPTVVNIGNGYLDFVFKTNENNDSNTIPEISGTKQRPAKPSRPPPKPFAKEKNGSVVDSALVSEQGEAYPYTYADNNPAIRISFDDFDSDYDTDDDEVKEETNTDFDTMRSDGYLRPICIRHSIQALEHEDAVNLSDISIKTNQELNASENKFARIGFTKPDAIQGSGIEIEKGERHDLQGNGQEIFDNKDVEREKNIKYYENVVQDQRHGNEDTVNEINENDQMTSSVFKLAKLFESNKCTSFENGSCF